jgi:hypothetical protein
MSQVIKGGNHDIMRGARIKWFQGTSSLNEMVSQVVLFLWESCYIKIFGYCPCILTSINCNVTRGTFILYFTQVCKQKGVSLLFWQCATLFYLAFLVEHFQNNNHLDLSLIIHTSMKNSLYQEETRFLFFFFMQKREWVPQRKVFFFRGISRWYITKKKKKGK